jgi:hypothetical protein
MRDVSVTFSLATMPVRFRVASADARRPDRQFVGARRHRAVTLPRFMSREPHEDTGMTTQDVHSTPQPTGVGWVNEIAGRIVSRHPTKAAALLRGRALARANASEHVIHWRDGTVVERMRYS